MVTATSKATWQTQHANTFDEMSAKNFPAIIRQGIEICTVPVNVQGLRHALFPNSSSLFGSQPQNLTPHHEFVKPAFEGS